MGIEIILIDRITTHLGKNPKRGGIPPSDRKFRAHEGANILGLLENVKMVVDVFMVEYNGRMTNPLRAQYRIKYP